MVQDHNQLYFANLIRKKVIIILSIVVALLLILLAMFICSSLYHKNELSVVNTLGRQRMLSQMMSKDVNLKYAILQALEDGPMVKTPEELQVQAESLNTSMLQAKMQFSDVLEKIRSGWIGEKTRLYVFGMSDQTMETIEDLGRQWDTFAQKVQTVIDSGEKTTQAAAAVVAVNADNERLLQSCDNLTQAVIAQQRSCATVLLWIGGALCLAVFLTLFILLRHFEIYILSPLSQIYSGIDHVGLLKKNFEISVPTKRELEPVMDEIQKGFDKLNRLIALISNVNQDISFEGIVDYIYVSFSDFIPYSHIGVALLKEDRLKLQSAYAVSAPQFGDLPKKLIGLESDIRQTSLSGVLGNDAPRIINDLEEYTRSKKNHDYNRIILQAGIRSSITLPLKINNRPIGVIFFSSDQKNIYRPEHAAFLETLSNSIAISINKNIFIDELLYSSILALAKMAEARDEDTGDHLERMKQYSKSIAQYLLDDQVYPDQLSMSFVKDIERFSPMHDIGKVGVRDGILLKPGKLSAEEFDEMKQHTVYGGQVLRTAEANIAKQHKSMFKTGIEIAEGHHEKWDGSGYPNGRAGTDIPLSARIVTVADVLDALTSRRPYKEPFPFDKSFSMVVQGRGTAFDPDIIDCLERHREKIHSLYLSFQDQRPAENEKTQ